MSALAISGEPEVGTTLALADVLGRARAFAEASVAENTRKAYASDLGQFSAFCGRVGQSAFPAEPQTLAAYAAALADEGRKISTIQRHLASVAAQHRRAGIESPTSHRIVRDVVRGIAREHGSQRGRKDALTLDGLRALLLAIAGDDAAALRDRAILLLGFAAALRRSELAALRVEDLRWTKRGLLVLIRRSKTDQSGEGVELAVPFVANEALCAARTVRRYLAASAITNGPLFRALSPRRKLLEAPIDGRDVARLVKKLAKRARLDGDFSGHSLRAGFATSAAAANVSLDSIARTTRHKSLCVLLGYVRPAQAFDDVALTSVVR